MSDKYILEKAIQKAIDGGWAPKFFAEPVVVGVSFSDYKTRIRFGSLIDGVAMAIQEVIFDHDFAKALWGERTEIAKMCSNSDCRYPREHIDEGLDIDYCPFHGNKLIEEKVYVGTQPWIKHLQKMVIEKDPIKYLSENI